MEGRGAQGLAEVEGALRDAVRGMGAVRECAVAAHDEAPGRSTATPCGSGWKFL